MTPSVETIRLLGRAEAFGWPQVIAGGICVTTEAAWRAAADLPGNHLPLERQLDEIRARCERWEEGQGRAAPEPTSEPRVVRDVDELEERADASSLDATPPPDPADILRAVDKWWPRVELPNGRVLHGEESWRAAVAERGADLLSIWRAIPDSEVDADRGD